uniref:F-box domain-containing protein n=1 Tax=Panagrolaimus superbus TaxID=310955 RepID=A0A914Y684_9BILA
MVMEIIFTIFTRSSTQGNYITVAQVVGYCMYFWWYKLVYLDVFQKYIRFFINDKQMIAYFGQEQQRIYSTINLNFYQSLETFLIDDIKPELNYLPQHSFRLHNFSTFKNAFVQKYSLPPPLIQYILRKASAKQLSSLFETCKHLFLLQTTPICCHLMVSNYLMYDERNSRSPCCQQSFKFSYFVPREFQNIFLVKSLIIESPKPATMLSAIIGKISRCEIWCLNVKGQTVFWNELRFLLESGNVEKFVFTGGCITVGYGQMATIEDVIGMLPKAHTVILDSAAFTPQTFSTLSKFNRTKKFKEFTIEKVTSCFRIFDFEYFIMKHAAPASNFNFVFEVFTPNDFIKKFNNFIKNLFRDWSPTKIKPKICITKKKK